MTWEEAPCPSNLACMYCGRPLKRGDPVWVVYVKCEVACSKYCASSADMRSEYVLEGAHK